MPHLSDEVGISIEIGVELFKDLIFKSYQAVASFAKDKDNEHDLFDTATRQYVGGLINRYNLVQVLGMREPVPLKKLFVRVNILEKISGSMGILASDLNDFFDFDQRAFGKTQETVGGELIINKLHKFIVLGKPGAGKTTYLKYLTLMMLDYNSKIKYRKLPVFVTLREWADTSMALIDFITQQFDTCGFEKALAFVEKMLRKGQCLVLFDGLDEVSEQMKQDDIIRQIRIFSDKYYDNKFIISCRVAAYNHEFAGFTEVEMADFNEAQMENFIRNWFSSEPKVATECWDRLKGNSSLRELASVPLLLTLLCLEYSESNDFPSNRADLYHRAIETLLTKWDSTRRIRRPEIYKKLTTRQKESMFARIAVGTFMENQYFINERKLIQMIERFVEHLPGFKEEELEPDSKNILKAIESQHGIFVERAKGVYSFAHLTFQEYFTANYIVENSNKGTIENLVDDYLYDSKWQEVFLLTAGLLGETDVLLLLMRRKSEEMLEVPEIHALMTAVMKSLFARENRYPAVIRRLLAGFIAIDLIYTRVRDSIRDPILNSVLNLILVLARALAGALDLNRTITLDLDRALARVLNHIRDLDHANDLDFNLRPLDEYGRANQLNRDTLLQIEKYLSAQILILKGLESANFISKSIRAKILHEMFLPK